MVGNGMVPMQVIRSIENSIEGGRILVPSCDDEQL